MPIFYRCSRCNTILYQFIRVGQDFYGIPTPSEVLSMYAGFCPQCGARLKKPTLDSITIEHIDEYIKRMRAKYARTQAIQGVSELAELASQTN